MDRKTGRGGRASLLMYNIVLHLALMGGAWTDMATFVVDEQLGQAQHLHNTHWCLVVTAL